MSDEKKDKKIVKYISYNELSQYYTKFTSLFGPHKLYFTSHITFKEVLFCKDDPKYGLISGIPVMYYRNIFNPLVITKLLYHNCPYLNKFICVAEDVEGKFAIYFYQHIQLKSINEFIKNRVLTLKQIKLIIKVLLKAVKYLHTRNVVHNNINLNTIGIRTSDMDIKDKTSHIKRNIKISDENDTNKENKENKEISADEINYCVFADEVNTFARTNDHVSEYDFNLWKPFIEKYDKNADGIRSLYLGAFSNLKNIGETITIINEQNHIGYFSPEMCVSLYYKNNEGEYNNKLGYKKNDLVYHPKDDLWSIGVILYILCSTDHVHPFTGNNDKETYRNIINLNYNKIGQNFLFYLEDFLDKIFKYRNERMTIDEALNHPFLKDISDRYI